VLAFRHQSITALLGYLSTQVKPPPPFLRDVVVVASSGRDGRRAAQLLKRHLPGTTVIDRPSASSRGNDIRRATAYRRLLSEIRKRPGGTVAAVAIDEREVGRRRRLSSGSIALAVHSGAAIVPVTARALFEVELARSWDRQRFPIGRCSIIFGSPFILKRGKGGEWRRGEARRLDEELEAMDAELGRSMNTRSFFLPPWQDGRRRAPSSRLK
jgi:lysophospholipid acyltransferase (LPLAT)-like uncharacterized protein